MLPNSWSCACAVVAIATKAFSSDLSAEACRRNPALIVTSAEVGALLLFVCVTLLLLRRRRETRQFRKELAHSLSLKHAVESVDKARAEFIASLVPQIRAPMNAIVGFVDLALKTDLDPVLRERLDAVRTSADWLMHIENDALEFSCIDNHDVTLDTVPFSISESIGSTMKIVEGEASAKELVTSWTIDGRLPAMVCGDPARFKHATFNLLDYAIRNTTTGSVVLSATLVSSTADEIFVRVAVTDTGMGIPVANRPLLLEPYGHSDVSAALRSDPTGFGLVISRRLIERMGGTTELHSEAGMDNTLGFSVRFHKQAVAAKSAGSNGFRKLSILVVEDSAVNRRLITKVLESAGHSVWAVTNGKDAVDTFRREGFDLIFMDVEMPDMDGLEATRAIRAAEAPNLRVPLYALTAHALPEDRDRCLAAGMDGFITKPIAANDVLQLVSTLAVRAADSWRPETEATINDTVLTPCIETEILTLPDDQDRHFEAEIDGSITELIAPDDLPNVVSTLIVPADGDELQSIPPAVGQTDETVLVGCCETGIREAGDVFEIANEPLNAPAGLALLEAVSAMPETLPFVGQNGDHAPAGDRDPFAQARKSLYKSDFAVRVIHNDGDPRDRNLI